MYSAILGPYAIIFFHSYIVSDMCAFGSWFGVRSYSSLSLQGQSSMCLHSSLSSKIESMYMLLLFLVDAKQVRVPMPFLQKTSLFDEHWTFKQERGEY